MNVSYLVINNVLSYYDPIKIGTYFPESKLIAKALKVINSKEELLSSIYKIFEDQFNFGENEFEEPKFIANIAGSKDNYELMSNDIWKLSNKKI